MSCGCENNSRGPCTTEQPNTATNESLPSQISNFTKSFYGEITKTEVNGQVVWILPCNLETGLPNNPRNANEGLACYFLRLFEDGIVGLTGPSGETGAAGANGYNAFTVTTTQFTQPTLDAPTVAIGAYANPAILVGMLVFVGGSGWYIVNAFNSGTIYLTLSKPLDGVSGLIAAGKLVVPAGYPGASITGATGPQGIQGVPGTPGASFTATNGKYSTAVGTDYALQVTSTAINFTTSSPQVLLPAAGTYLLTAVIELDGETGVLANDTVTMKLRNTSVAADVADSEQDIAPPIDGERKQLILHALHSTDSVNQTVALYGDCATADVVSVVALRTKLTYVRLS